MVVSGVAKKRNGTSRPSARVALMAIAVITEAVAEAEATVAGAVVGMVAATTLEAVVTIGGAATRSLPGCLHRSNHRLILLRFLDAVRLAILLTDLCCF